MALKKPTPAFENENSGVATAETCQTRNEAAVNAVMGDLWMEWPVRVGSLSKVKSNFIADRASCTTHRLVNGDIESRRVNSPPLAASPLLSQGFQYLAPWGEDFYFSS